MSDTPVHTVNIGPSTPAPASPESTPEATSAAPIESQDSVDTSREEGTTEASEKEEDTRFGDRFAALSREEAKIRQTRLDMKSEQEKITEYNDLKAKIEADPMAALAHFGVDLDALIMRSLGEDAPVEEVDPVTKLQKDFEDYKSGVQKDKDDAETARIDEHNSAIDAAVEDHKKKIEQSLKDNADKYELIELNGAQDLVWEVTEAHYDDTNEVLSPEEAADLVEAHLDEQYQKFSAAKKYNKEPKIEDTAPTNNEPVIQKINTQTLSNSTSTNTPQSTPVERTYLDMEESKRAAAALLKWD